VRCREASRRIETTIAMYGAGAPGLAVVVSATTCDDRCQFAPTMCSYIDNRVSTTLTISREVAGDADENNNTRGGKSPPRWRGRRFPIEMAK
jgi:hypothetical protein